MRSYLSFTFKEATFRISSPASATIIREVRRQRALLERYIAGHPAFRTAMEPLPLRGEAPEIVRRMARAAQTVGVGPMAAVAGAVAQMAAEAALAAGATEAIVENGGDVYLASPEAVVVALHAGDHPLSGRLALRVSPEEMPVGICSSSSRMGHSVSLGRCDLATVAADQAALADAAATLACNLVGSPQDVEAALERICALSGVRGALIVQGDRVGAAGALPELVRHSDEEVRHKVSRHPQSDPLAYRPVKWREL